MRNNSRIEGNHADDKENAKMKTTWKMKMTKPAATLFLAAIGHGPESAVMAALARLPALAVVVSPPSGPDTKANAEGWAKRAIAEIAAESGNAMVSMAVVKQTGSASVESAV